MENLNSIFFFVKASCISSKLIQFIKKKKKNIFNGSHLATGLKSYMESLAF